MSGYFDFLKRSSSRRDNRSDFYVDYRFSFKGQEEEHFSYRVPFEDYIAGIVAYFDFNSVKLDGTDNSVFNVLSGLGALSELEDKEYFIEFVTEKCKEKALEEFTEEKEDEEAE